VTLRWGEQDTKTDEGKREGRRRDKGKEKETKSNPYFRRQIKARETALFFFVIPPVVKVPPFP